MDDPLVLTGLVSFQVDLGYVFVLPERDAEGRRVIFNYAHVLVKN